MSVTIATRVAGDLDESFADGDGPILAVLGHDELAGHDLRNQPDVMRVDAHLSLDGRQGDHVDVFREDDCLRRHDFKSERVSHMSRHCGSHAWAISSIPPFM